MPSTRQLPFRELRDCLEINSEHIRKGIASGHVHSSNLHEIREKLIEAGRSELAAAFDYGGAGSCEDACEEVGRLDVEPDQRQLLKDILGFLKKYRDDHRKPSDVAPAWQKRSLLATTDSEPASEQNGVLRRYAEPTLGAASARAGDCSLGDREWAPRVRETELEKGSAELRTRVRTLEEERDALVARREELQNRLDALMGTAEGQEMALRQMTRERDELQEVFEELKLKMAKADGVWRALNGAMTGLQDNCVSRVVKEFGSDNLRDGADHAVLLALLVTVCRAEVEDNRFLERFVFLEGEIETACAGDASRRDRLRGIVGPILAGRLSHWRIDWALAGKSFDSRFCVPVSDSGTRIVEVLTAALWRDGDCVRRARVRTI